MLANVWAMYTALTRQRVTNLSLRNKVANEWNSQFPTDLLMRGWVILKGNLSSKKTGFNCFLDRLTKYFDANASEFLVLVAMERSI